MKSKKLDSFHPPIVLMEFNELPKMYDHDGIVTMALDVNEVSPKQLAEAIGVNKQSRTVGSLHDCLTDETIAGRVHNSFLSFMKDGDTKVTSVQLPEEFGMDSDVTHTGTMKRRLQAEGIEHDDFDQHRTVVIVIKD